MQCGGSSIDDEKIAQRRDLLARLRTLTPAARTHAATQILAHLAAACPPDQHPVLAGFLPLPGEPDLTPFFLAVIAAGGTVAVPRLVTSERMEFRSLPGGDAEGLKGLKGPEGRVAPDAGDAAAGRPPRHRHLREPDPAHCPLIDPSSLTLILVPGLGFTRGGQRLGRGGGYYDRWLATLDPVRRPPVMGVAFACQIVPTLPVAAHDQWVDAIVTEDGWLPGRGRPPAAVPPP